MRLMFFPKRSMKTPSFQPTITALIASAEIADLVAKKRAVEFLKDPGRSMGQAAIAFILANPVFASVLVTTVDEDRIAEYAEASSLPLTGEELARIEELRTTNFGVQSGYVAALKS